MFYSLIFRIFVKRKLKMVHRVGWTANEVIKPSNKRPVTVVLRDLKGTYTSGAYYDHDDKEWRDMRSDEIVEEQVVCWTDIEIPEEHLF